jgi:hypothetical protein
MRDWLELVYEPGLRLRIGVTAWVNGSIFLGGFKVQWHTLSRWFANVEIDVRLLVAFGVLLSPQD